MNRMEALSNRATDAASGSELDLDSLWEAYTVSRDEALRNRLLLHYLPLSRMIARHIHSRMPTSVELDDLAQAAIFGLRAAIASFDSGRGIRFEHYCGPRVRGAVLDHLRSLDWAPRMLRSRVQRVREMAQQIEMETGTEATDEQVSSALNMPLDELQSLRGEMAAPVRLRITSGESDDEHAVNLEMLPDKGNADPLLDAQRADLREFLVKGLSPAERQVLLLYYYDNLNLREIGETLNLCESRVSQIHHAVIKRLRERMHRIGGTSIED
jgi:RNA polymerase sigma factor for flagellar operon FliA